MLHQIPLQAIAYIGSLVTDLDLAPRKMPGQLSQLSQQTLEGRPAFEINSFAAVFVERRTVVLNPSRRDIMTLIRRLLITCNDSSGMIDHFEDPLPRAALDSSKRGASISSIPTETSFGVSSPSITIRNLAGMALLG
jgi:hypothetical protein